MEKLSKNIDINMNYLSKLLCINKSFDLITRVIELKGHKAAIYCIDGFVKSDTLEKLLEFMFKKKQTPSNSLKIFQTGCIFFFDPLASLL